MSLMDSISGRRKSAEGTSKANRMLVLSNAGLALTCFLLAYKTTLEHPPVVLVPPQLTEKAQVSWNAADEPYMRSVCMFVAMMAGNVDPKNARFVAETLSSIVDPKIYSEFRKNIMAYAEDPLVLTSGSSRSFSAKDIVYEKETDHVWVSGDLITTGNGVRSAPVPTTFEFTIQIRSQRPVITDIQNYEGNYARTRDYLEKHPDEGKPKPKVQPGGNV